MKDSKKAVAFSSVIASLSLTLLKLIVGLLTGSIGILSEAAHSGLDLVAATITFFAVRISDKPADKTHTYGHGKVENISAFVETGLLILTSAWIIYEAVHRLLTRSTEIEIAWYSFAVMITSIVVDVARSRVLNKVAKATKSQALEADALHFQSDIISSGVVIIGLILAALGIPGADAYAAIGVAILVIFAGYRLGKRSVDILIDATPPGVVDQIALVASHVEGILSIDRLRVRPTGVSYYVDMTVKVNRKLSSQRIHSVSVSTEKAIQSLYPDADIVIHARPVAVKDETIVEQIRIIAGNHNYEIHDIVVQNLENKKYISYDLEVDNAQTLAKAHETATQLEETIRSELGEDLEISTHIEPLKKTSITADSLSPAKEQRIREEVQKVITRFPQIRHVTQLSLRKMQGRIFISIHCNIDKDTPLEEAHTLSSKLEYLTKEAIPELERAVVHLEPT